MMIFVMVVGNPKGFCQGHPFQTEGYNTFEISNILDDAKHYWAVVLKVKRGMIDQA